MSLKDVHLGITNSSYMFELPCFKEDDGDLGTFEPDMVGGFNVKRLFYIYGVPSGTDRANHACMNASFIFISMVGTVRLSIERGGIEKEYVLKDKKQAVYVPPASWIKAYDFSNDAILLGLSNVQYRNCNYANDYCEYKRLIGEKES